jgi:hypothetical protein
MDKPRHPLVIRPWKTQQTKKNKWNVPTLKSTGGHVQINSNARTRSLGPKSRSKRSK